MKALLLAAGEGRRPDPFAQVRPKAILPLAKRADRLPRWGDWEANSDTRKVANGSHSLVLEPYTVERSFRHTYPVEVQNG